MITEKLVIENFAGLKYIDIEIKKINVFIGTQASGKSLIAKILFYCKELVDDVFSHAINLQENRGLNQEIKNKFEEYFPPDYWGDKDFSICYSIGEEYIKIKASKTDSRKAILIIQYSDFHKNNLERVVKASRHTFIPSGRSFFVFFQNNISNFLSANNEINPFLLKFVHYYEKVKNLPSKDTRVRGDIDSLKKKILKGEYTLIKGKDYLKMNDGRQVQLSHCSAGQQEMLPLTLILENLILFDSSFSGDSIYIEEPESHLFPTVQKDIVDFIATVYNFKKKRTQFVITTHSPYILTSFNNLLHAGILAQDASEDELKRITRIIPNSRFLNTDEVAVYSLSNGTCNSIISSETGLIDAEIIDSVSEDLSIEFDNLSWA